MGYLKIVNLYRNTDILEFRQCYALEKIHGTSAHILWKGRENCLSFFSGGAKHENFVALFEDTELHQKFSTVFGAQRAVVYGEAYGGSMQRMSATYGKELKFVAFDVKIEDAWLSVPQAEEIVRGLELEFVHYKLISTDLEKIDAERDADSVQAIRNGCGEGKMREGIVLRPPFEVTLNNGARLITKHKRDDFRETKTPRKVGVDAEVLKEARAIAEEWATEMRLEHVLQKLPEATGLEHTGDIIRAMIADIEVEGEGEIEWSKAAKKAVGAATVKLWKARISKLP